jgi:hypothetical protein
LKGRGAGGSTIVESDLSGNLQNEYVFFNGARIARRDSSGNVYYNFADHLGNTFPFWPLPARFAVLLIVSNFVATTTLCDFYIRPCVSLASCAKILLN